MDYVSSNIASKRAFYSNKLKTFGNWSTKKSTMNGTADKYIRTMLVQMLRELGLPVKNAPNIINSIYARDFDCTKIVNIISKHRSPIFDILSSDQSVRMSSIQTAVKSLETVGVKTAGLHTGQISGLCIFIQFILCGGRNELEGFGVSENLVEKWKKTQKTLKNKQIKQRQKEIQDACKLVKVITLDDDEENEKEDCLEPVSVPDSWEDL